MCRGEFNKDLSIFEFVPLNEGPFQDCSTTVGDLLGQDGGDAIRLLDVFCANRVGSAGGFDLLFFIVEGRCAFWSAFVFQKGARIISGNVSLGFARTDVVAQKFRQRAFRTHGGDHQGIFSC